MLQAHNGFSHVVTDPLQHQIDDPLPDRIEPVGLEEAKQYYEDLPEHEMSYAEAFGEEPEEA